VTHPLGLRLFGITHNSGIAESNGSNPLLERTCGTEPNRHLSADDRFSHGKRVHIGLCLRLPHRGTASFPRF
jgi:hypothetical protein